MLEEKEMKRRTRWRAQNEQKDGQKEMLNKIRVLCKEFFEPTDRTEPNFGNVSLAILFARRSNKVNLSDRVFKNT